MGQFVSGWFTKYGTCQADLSMSSPQCSCEFLLEDWHFIFNKSSFLQDCVISVWKLIFFCSAFMFYFHPSSFWEIRCYLISNHDSDVVFFTTKNTSWHPDILDPHAEGIAESRLCDMSWLVNFPADTQHCSNIARLLKHCESAGGLSYPFMLHNITCFLQYPRCLQPSTCFFTCICIS